MDESEVRKAIENFAEFLKDPLEKKGVEKDWICIIGEKMAEEILKLHPEIARPFPEKPDFASVTGRETHVSEFCPNDGLYYFDPDPMGTKKPQIRF